jgi:GMP synthase (glutamine-hydrolysing)
MLNILKEVTKKTLAEIAEEKIVRKTNELFLLFSLGSQTDHLIMEVLGKLGVYCLMASPSTITAADVKNVDPIGIIFSGGPASTYENPPSFDREIFGLGIPTLGICLGKQMMADYLGIQVSKAEKREHGIHDLKIVTDTPLFYGCPSNMPVMQNHGDVVSPSAIFKTLAITENTPVAAANYKHLWGVQFHPEVPDTEYGPQIFENFCFRICGAKDRFPAENVAQRKIEEIRTTVGNEKVLLALSGGSDSSTCAYLLKKAFAGEKGRIRAVYIKGIDRPDDLEFVLKYFGDQPWLELKIIDATERFLKAVKDIPDMDGKRQAMKHKVYGEILDEEAELFGGRNCYIVQGTLYTDLSESGLGYETGAGKSVIKSHHNVGLKLKHRELLPLDDCVKDSGRNIGIVIGVPEELITRQPFPGPGILIRIEGVVTAEKLKVVRQADGIYIGEMRNRDLYRTVWQAGATLINYSTIAKDEMSVIANNILCEEIVKYAIGGEISEAEIRLLNSVITCNKGDGGVSGNVAEFRFVPKNRPDYRPSWEFLKCLSRRLVDEMKEIGGVVICIGAPIQDETAVALWAVWSENGFTARAAELPWDFIDHVSDRIKSEVEGIGAVVYRISGKPPTTIEWG